MDIFFTNKHKTGDSYLMNTYLRLDTYPISFRLMFIFLYEFIVLGQWNYLDLLLILAGLDYFM